MKTLVAVTLAFLSMSAAAQTATLETQNEQVVRRYIEAFNRGDAKAAAADFSEDAANFGRSRDDLGLLRQLGLLSLAATQ